MQPALSRTSRRLLLALRVLASLVIALQLAAPLLSEEIAWGLWPGTFLSTLVRWLFAMIALVLVWGGERLWQSLPPVRAALTRVRFTSLLVRLAICLVAGAFFYLFRIRYMGWGDAALLVKALADPYRITYVWQAPLDVFLHARAWQLGNALFGWPDPVPVYRILSTFAGMAFVWVLISLAILLGRNRTERAAIVGLVLTLGTMQLFFGYIENYSIMTLGILIYAYLGLLRLQGRIALVWPAVALALTNAFHPSTIILTPSLIYLAVTALPIEQGNIHSVTNVLKKEGWRIDVRSVLSVVLPYTLVFAGVVALMSSGEHGLDALVGVDFPGGGDRSWFVPLFEVTTKWQHYTMFSIGHLVDIVNQQLLVAPMVWPSLILIGLLAGHRIPRGDANGWFLLLMAGCYLLLILVWNADYGGQKDWDLFSPAAVPAALLLAWVLPRALVERPALGAGAAAMIASQGFHLVAWVWRNTFIR